MTKDLGVQVGARIPDFTLKAANRDGSFHLYEMLEREPVIVEFLRGTW